MRIINFVILFIIYIILIVLLYVYNPTTKIMRTCSKFDLLQDLCEDKEATAAFRAFSIIIAAFGFFIFILLGAFIVSTPHQTRPGYNLFGNIINYFFDKTPIDNSFYHYLSFMFKTIGVLCGIFLIIFLIILGTQSWLPQTSAISFTLNTMIFLGLLMLIQRFILPQLKLGTFDTSTTFGLIMSIITNLIFYIPCLITRFIEFCIGEYKNTTAVTLIILVIELCLIGLYICLPLLTKHLIIKDGIILTEEKQTIVKLNKQNTLGSSEQFNKIFLENSKYKPKYVYAISFWFYINPQPPSTNANYSNPTTIFNYGGKPKILYQANNNVLSVTMKTKGNNGHENKEEIVYSTTELLLQRWNNIVLNYDGGTLDVFLNNKLVASQENLVPYMKLDSILAGETNGITGQLCNAIYFNKILKKQDIFWLYEAARLKNPPII